MVDLQCTADADPQATFSISGGDISPVIGSTTGIIRIRVDLAKDGKIVKCTPFNRLGNGPTADILLDVKGRYITVNSARNTCMQNPLALLKKQLCFSNTKHRIPPPPSPPPPPPYICIR